MRTAREPGAFADPATQIDRASEGLGGNSPGGAEDGDADGDGYADGGEGVGRDLHERARPRRRIRRHPRYTTSGSHAEAARRSPSLYPSLSLSFARAARGGAGRGLDRSEEEEGRDWGREEDSGVGSGEGDETRRRHTMARRGDVCVCPFLVRTRPGRGVGGLGATRGCGCGPSDLLMDGSGLQVDWAHGIGDELDSKHRLGFFKKKLLYNTK